MRPGLVRETECDDMSRGAKSWSSSSCGASLTSDEMELASKLIEKMSTAQFDPTPYEDEYRNRVLAMIEEKTKGREIAIP